MVLVSVISNLSYELSDEDVEPIEGFWLMGFDVVVRLFRIVAVVNRGVCAAHYWHYLLFVAVVHSRHRLAVAVSADLWKLES